MDLTTFTLNCSILYGAVLPSDALRRATDAGFTTVEFWWPFSSAAPDADEVGAFIDAVKASGVTLKGMNLFAGDMAGGDRGVLSWPGRSEELRASVEVAARVAAETGCGIFNALYGRRRADATPQEQDAVARDNLVQAATRLGEVGGTVVLEAISGVDDYPLKTTADVVAFLDRHADLLPQNVAVLLDIYHLSTNGDDVAGAIDTHAARIAHVQIADAPGRGIPGSGTLPLESLLARLRDRGYTGDIALEFTSTDPVHAFATQKGQ